MAKNSWYFLGVVLVLYILMFIIKPGFLLPALTFFWGILKKIVPIFVLVFVIMFLTNYFVNQKKLVTHLGKKAGSKSWLIAVVAGIISSGPIYMWYPMLAELREKGVRQGVVATFLYARAIKPALIPLMIVYFGLPFTIILTLLLVPFSIAQGKLIEKIVGG